MARLEIDIPDELKAKLEARAAESGSPTVEAYAASLLRADADTMDYGAPAHLSVRSREQLEALLIEGEASPAREMTGADWDEMRRRLIDRHRQSRAG